MTRGVGGDPGAARADDPPVTVFFTGGFPRPASYAMGVGERNAELATPPVSTRERRQTGGSFVTTSEGSPPTPDPLAALFKRVRPLGAWVAEAACADLAAEDAAVYTSDNPDPDALAVAEATCWGCAVRQQCADYASQGAAYGLWGTRWHDGKARPRRAA